MAEDLLDIVLQLGGKLDAVLAVIEVWLRDIFARAGLSPHMQTLALLLGATVLVGFILTYSRGMLRLAFLMGLLIVAAYIILPMRPI